MAVIVFIDIAALISQAVIIVELRSIPVTVVVYINAWISCVT